MNPLSKNPLPLLKAFEPEVQSLLLLPLVKQRWYRSKERRAVSLSLEDAAVIKDGDRLFLLSLLSVVFENAEPETYFVPLQVNQVSSPDVFAALKVNKTAYYLTDAVKEPAFESWWTRQALNSASFQTEKGMICFEKRPGFSVKDSLKPEHFQFLNVEQSNSSFVIQNRFIFKILRKKERGINCEIEMLRAFADRGFEPVPQLKAEAVYKNDSGEASSLGVLLNFVPAKGDGWSYLVDFLQRQFKKLSGKSFPALESQLGGWHQNLSPALERIGRLGVITGKMHRVLSQESEDPAFKPEIINEEDVQNWKNYYLQTVRDALNTLQRKIRQELPPELKSRYKKFLFNDELIYKKGDVLKLISQRECWKIRCHGDFHLGQVLDGKNDWTLFDFEGEPLRTLEQRRAKYCALKDVAGMLRSFDYATFVSAQNTATNKKIPFQSLTPFIEISENVLREAFLKGYYSVFNKKDRALYPQKKEENQKILFFFELEKAFYELQYELNNRPQWAITPLKGIERIIPLL